MIRSSVGLAVGILCTMLALGCGRSRESWSGVRTVEDGDRLMLASYVGFCGAVTLTNISGRNLTLQASRGGTVVGQAPFRAGENMRVRFDWAGDLDGDVYLLDVIDSARDEELDFDATVRIVRRSSWSECPPGPHHFAPLGMNIAFTGHTPGEHEYNERAGDHDAAREVPR